jgi:RNA polymerase sigma-70 factor (ECF subfamily)
VSCLTGLVWAQYGQRHMTLAVEASDGDLARAIAARTDAAEAAEAELYRRFAPRVRLYGLRHLRDEEAARDLMQQVLLLAIQKLRDGAVTDPDLIGSFILGASRMLSVNLKRRDRRREALQDTFLVPQAFEETGSSFDTDQLAACLASLPERERLVVLLSFYAERSASEVGRTLGLSDGNIRVIRCRAIGRLRTCMRASAGTP